MKLPLARCETLVGLLLGVTTLSGCGSSGASAPAPPVATSSPATVLPSPTPVAVLPSPTPAASTAPASIPVDPTNLPSGDGKLSATTPQVGYVYSCTSTFNGGGATGTGAWVHSDGTWDSTTKISVQGSVNWPNASLALTISGTTRRVTTNDLPNHATGTFPIAASDPAHQYDGNPNTISAQNLAYTLPQLPTVNANPTCVGLGPIGILNTGSVFFNALDAVGRDAGEHEVQDACQGHPEISGAYHYHSVTSCLTDAGTSHSNLLGYARDGFGMYGNRGVNGESLTNKDLDVCHGHTHAVTWDGQSVSLYHYHATKEYPYTVGCYRGTPQ